MENPNSDTKKNPGAQPSDATSSKTLSDLEEDQKVPAANSGSGAGPSPDGQLDESDEKENADAM